MPGTECCEAAAQAVHVALETSSARPSVAARLGDRCLEAQLSGESAHASDLLPVLERLLHELGAHPVTAEGRGSPRSMGAVLVGTGPGSYTGLRVGLATALGLARGTGAQLGAVPSLEAQAFGDLAPGESAAFLLDARQGELYLARYRRELEAVSVLLAPCVTTREQVATLLVPGERLFADEAALRAAGLDRLREEQPARCVTDRVPRARSVLDLGALRLALEGADAPEEVEPLYLRAFAAKARRR